MVAHIEEMAGRVSARLGDKVKRYTSLPGELSYDVPAAQWLEVARTLRARDPSIQILFISGHPDDLQDVVRRDLGQVEALEKPLDTGRVVSWVQLAVNKSPAAPATTK